MQNTLIKSSLALAVSLATSTATAESTQDEISLDTIMVTGQKMERSLQDTKESIVVLTADDLEGRSLYNLDDVFQQTPGVTGDQFGFRIRGVRSSDGASQPNRGDLATVVIDGVAASGWVKSEAIGQLWDTAQVEVLRGPQSTNLGRNALAGAVVINTQDPVYANEGKVRVGFGNYGSSEYKGVANINLADGIAALRISAEKNDTDGYTDNKTRNEDDFGDAQNDVYRMKLLVEPNDDLRMVLSYMRLENNYGDTRTILGDYDLDDRVSLSNTDGIFETKADLASLNLDFQINNNWSLKSISAYQDGERDRQSDADSGPTGYGNGGGVIYRQSEDNNWSQELRLNFDSGSVRGSTGVYYTKIEAERNQQANNDLNLVAQFNSFAPGLGLLLTNPIDLTPFGGSGELPALYPVHYGTEQVGFTNVDTTNWAVFSEWEFDLNQNLTLNVGARYDNEEQEYETASSSSSPDTLPSTIPSPIANAPLPQVGMSLNDIINLANNQLSSFTQDVPRSSDKKTFDNLLPHAGISYHINDDVTGSFFVKKSYRSGGSELTLRNGINDFDAEELWNYEFALRSILFNGSGVFNANLYYSDWDKQQVQVQEPGTSSSAFTMTVNTGKSKLYGAEVSFDYDVNENISVYTGGALNKTEYVDFISADGEDHSGNEFTFAPKQTLVAGLRYQVYNGLFFNTSANYAGKSYSDVANENELSGRTLLDINGGYEMDNLKFELYVKNVFDRTYETNNVITAADGTQMTRLGAPRLIGARATYSF